MKKMMGVAKTGAVITLGFAGHKALQKLLSDMVFSRIFGAPAAPPTPEQPNGAPAQAGIGALEFLSPYRGLISGALTVAAGVLLTNKLVKRQETRMLITGGMAASFLHTVLVTLLDRVAPAAAGYLSGYSDGTAARLSAMYGLGAGTSIQPHYSPIGEYFTEGGAMGEYFTEGMGHLGEYFTEGGAMGAVGNYGSNPDLYQAAAGFGAMDYSNGNHVDPSSDLDRELTIAEAAAGVGALPAPRAFQAAAGMGAVQPYEASAGIGAIARVPTADTWVPGTTDPQLWAGVRGVTRPQAASEMTPAGVLQTDGGQGVFG